MSNAVTLMTHMDEAAFAAVRVAPIAAIIISIIIPA
jgi:hypothetical protein